MNITTNKSSEANSMAEFSKRIQKYQNPVLWKSIWQIANTFIPYVGIWFLIFYTLHISWVLTGFLILLAAGFLVRLFIIFHDCGHGSYFRSQKANRIVGMIFGILAFTPYDKWHNQHLKHHATVGNLDKRGVGDVWTMTTEEYDNSSKFTRIKYRIYRNPFVMFGIGSLYVFLIQNRLTQKFMTKKEKSNIYLTNLILAFLFVMMGSFIGFADFILIQLLILYFAAMAGIWLFYLQHQYEHVSWVRNKDWNFRSIAINGSSYVKFPKILQWFSGNIGFHHIHHMNARIPNYNLPKCFQENDVFRKVKPITFTLSMKSLNLRLWDEQLQKLVSFRRKSSVNFS